MQSQNGYWMHITQHVYEKLISSMTDRQAELFRFQYKIYHVLCVQNIFGEKKECHAANDVWSIFEPYPGHIFLRRGLKHISAGIIQNL